MSDSARDRLTFPSVTSPTVSIVIPVHNHKAVTLACLRSVHANTSLNDVEVIVVDDASDDGTDTMLDRHQGLRVCRLDTNQGFGHAVTHGVSVARGQFLVLLNNDTEVAPGWLDSLLETVLADRTIGAVGSKLVFPDGTLQEAGSVIWSDGTGWNLGWGADPDDPAFNVRRDVDYCSAAALLIRREAWDRVGGFDERFAPAYYEDTDLCFALRRAGYRVVYDPFSLVLHHHSVSHTAQRGAQPPPHSKRVMEVNRHIFAAKWAVELDRHWPGGTAHGLLGGRMDYRPRVLVCDHLVPMRDRDSGGLRMASILDLLTQIGCQVTLLPLDGVRRQPYTRDLQKGGVEVVYHRWGLADLARQRPGHFNLAIISRVSVGRELQPLVRRAFPTATLVYDTVDLHHVREERRLAVVGRDAAEAADIRRSELALIRGADVVSAVSDAEAETIKRLAPGQPVVLLPNVHVVRRSASPAMHGRDGLLFIGGFDHPPNVDGMLWFMREILPCIASARPMHITVLGSNPPPEIRALQSSAITVTGYVPDVEEFFDRALVFVAPLRYGAGLKGKVGQAMSLSLPVVTTRIGAEGLGIINGKHALVRDTAEGFAEAVLRVASDEPLWERLSREGRELVADTLTPEKMRERLVSLMHSFTYSRHPVR